MKESLTFTEVLINVERQLGVGGVIRTIIISVNVESTSYFELISHTIPFRSGVTA